MTDLGKPPVEAINTESVLKLAEDPSMMQEVGIRFLQRLGASTVAHAVNYAVSQIFQLNEDLSNTIDVTPRE